MHKVIKGIVIFISILLAASLLKGAGVGNESWYAAPHNLSQFLVTVLTMWGVVNAGLYLLQLFFRKN